MRRPLGRRCYNRAVGRTTTAIALGAALLTAAAACSSTSSGAGLTDAAAEAAGVNDDAQGGAAGDDASGAAACAAAGGQCEVGAVCEEVAPGACGPGGSVCCLHVLCADDAKVQLIQASDYDQSCTVDSDCVEVYVGNACSCENRLQEQRGSDQQGGRTSVPPRTWPTAHRSSARARHRLLSA